MEAFAYLEMFLGAFLIIVAAIGIKKSDSTYTCVGLLFLGIALLAIGENDLPNKVDSVNNIYSIDDIDDDYLDPLDDIEDDSNISFKSSEVSRKRGTKCHYIDYGSGSLRECSDKGKCRGFSPQNRDPFTCSNCKHSISEHY